MPRNDRFSRPAAKISLCALFTTLIIAGTFIKIPIPLMPITLQTLFTTLAGMLLGAKLGALSVVVYVIMGLIGIPVFTQGGGIGMVLTPTFGYTIAFIIATFVTGYITYSFKNTKPSFLRLTIAGSVGMVIIYIIGTIYFVLISKLYIGTTSSLSKLLYSCLIIPLPGDIIKLFACVGISYKLIPLLNRMFSKGKAPTPNSNNDPQTDQLPDNE